MRSLLYNFPSMESCQEFVNNLSLKVNKELLSGVEYDSICIRSSHSKESDDYLLNLFKKKDNYVRSLVEIV